MKSIKVNRDMKKSLFILTACSLLSKCLGLVRDMLLAGIYGANSITDAYIIAYSIPTILIGSIAAALATNYLPILSETDIQEGESKVEAFNSSIVKFTIVFVTIVLIVFFMFNDEILKMFAIGFEAEQFSVLKVFSNIMIFSSYTILLTEIFNGYAQYKNNFNTTAISGVILNILIIIGIVVSQFFDIHFIAIFYLLGHVISIIYIYLNTKMSGFKMKRDKIPFYNNGKVKKLLILSIPIFLNNAIWEINVMIDKSITSTVGEGFISSINYANKIIGIITGLFVISFVTIIYPKLVKLYQNRDVDKFSNNLCDFSKVTSLFCIPSTLYLIYFSKDIIMILFGRGNFSIDAVENTNIFLMIFCLSILPQCLKTIFFKAYYSRQDTKAPSFNAVIAIVLNIILNLMLVKPFGANGVVFATVVSSWISCVLLLFNGRHFFLKQDIINFLKYSMLVFILTFASILPIHFLFEMLSIHLNSFLHLLISGTLMFSLFCIYNYTLFKIGKLSWLKILFKG